MNTCPICKSAIISGDNKICGSCLRLYQRVYRKKRAIEYLGGKCEKCGRTDLVTLTFHHINPHLKSYNISDWIAGRHNSNASWEAVKQELGKCMVLCLNCHRIEHEHGHELKEFLPYLSKKQRKLLEEEVLTDNELFQFWDNEKKLDELLKRATEVEEVVKPKTNNCLFCGEPSSEWFCSDYCKEQAKSEAISLGNGELFDYWTKNGYQMTGSVYKLKKQEINNKLGFL